VFMVFLNENELKTGFLVQKQMCFDFLATTIMIEL
jgi:hypothetical protein